MPIAIQEAYSQTAWLSVKPLVGAHLRKAVNKTRCLGGLFCLLDCHGGGEELEVLADAGVLFHARFPIDGKDIGIRGEFLRRGHRMSG